MLMEAPSVAATKNWKQMATNSTNNNKLWCNQFMVCRIQQRKLTLSPPLNNIEETHKYIVE